MKQVLFLLLLITTVAQSQTRQPFSKIGKKVKVVTLSNGKFDEFFDEDSLQRIGSSVINVNTKKVTKINLTQAEIDELENAQASRFLSVDPLTSSFAMLTPYQYASNRPIDGIDLDGLEYVTYTININLGKRTKGEDGKFTVGAITSASYVWHDANQHNAHGPLGQGVQYIINYEGAPRMKSAYFVSRNASKLGFITEYGNYMGATSLMNIQTDGHGFTNKYNYDLPAVDQVDFLAYQHDKGYDALDAVGANSLFNDWGTTPVDEAALNGWDNFRENYKTGSTDPYNNQKVTSSERWAAKKGSLLFGEIVANKKSSISIWMQDNYAGEAKNNVNKGMYGKSDMNYNYNLFLNKYMQKNEEGKWVRKEGMWSKDKDNNWTPNKPKK